MNKAVEKTVPATSKNNGHESRIVRLEVIIENINNTLMRLERRLDTIEKDVKDNFKWNHNDNDWLCISIVWVHGKRVSLVLNINCQGRQNDNKRKQF